MIKKTKKENQLQKLEFDKLSKDDCKFILGRGNDGVTEELYGAYN